MAALEAELKVQLLIRSAQGVTPTATGKVLYQHAPAILRQVAATREAVRQAGIGGESGLWR